MFVKVNSCATVGLDCELVAVETDHTATQLPKTIIVGLPDAAVQEAKERVKLAIKNSGFSYPRKKVIINLAPADIRKEGPAYDLPIAISILLSTGQLETNVDDSIFVGELALNGELRHTNGILSMVLFAREHGFKNIFIPSTNAIEASLIDGVNIYPIKSLIELVNHLKNNKTLNTLEQNPNNTQEIHYETDMQHVKGQEQVKRALEIAAAGFHNVLMSGPPGSGKTLLARTMPSILPELSANEKLEVTRICSIAGTLPKNQPMISERPFRAPHHTASGVALVGGGKYPRPGEISLAHRGILFLDEFPEFPRAVLENLRQPLEDGVVSISRAQGTLTFPANFMLVASQNPCPCGYYSDTERTCTCTTTQILKYQKKISGPLLDRIDVHIEVPRLSFEKLQGSTVGESSADIRRRVQSTVEIQQQRFKDLPISYNSEMRPQDVKKFCNLNNESISLLRNATKQLQLSARSYHRILKLARTIADLDNHSEIQTDHIAEALQYRAKQQ